MFGIGYATAEDRLFFIDALRHAGQGDLASFAGGSNVAMDESVWANEPYTQQDLVNQVNYGLARPARRRADLRRRDQLRERHQRLHRQAKQPLNSLTMMPAEYAALGMPNGRQPFTLENLVSIATLVGGDLRQRRRRPALQRGPVREPDPQVRRERYVVAGSPTVIAAEAHKKPSAAHGRQASRGSRGQQPTTRASRTFLSFDAPNDPEAPTTVHGKAFPYQTLPKPSKAVARTIALPDSGSVQLRQPRRRRRAAVERSAAARAGARPATPRRSDRPRARAVGQRRPRAARLPARDVQRAADQRPRQRQRPSAGGDGAAGRPTSRPRS